MSRLLSTAVNHVATSPERSATRVRFLEVITAAVDAQTGSATKEHATRRHGAPVWISTRDACVRVRQIR